MALSASIDFTLTRDTCIEEALSQLGVLGEGISPTAAQLTADSRTLNLMLKSWQTKEFTQNLITRIYVFMQDEQREYDLSTTAASSDESTGVFYHDTVATALAASSTALVVTLGTSTSNSDRIGIELDNGKMHWTTISSGGGTASITLAAGPATAAAVGNSVYAYTTKATRPLDILYATLNTKPSLVGLDNVIDETAIPCSILTRERWTDLSLKGAEGQPNSIWYNEQWPTAKLHVWPEPPGGAQVLELWCQTTIDDMDAATNNFALPSKWYLAVAFQLAFWLAPKYGVSDKTFTRIRNMASMALDDAESGESEDWLQFTPDDRGRM